MPVVQTFPAAELSAEHRSVWADLQRQNPFLGSAFYAPDFTDVISAVRDDVEVAVVSERNSTIGFLPYLRGPNNTARPVAGRLTEFQGPVCRRDFTWDPCEVMRGAGLKAWYFDHLPVCHTSIESHAWGAVPSPYIDLEHGFAHYEADLHRRGRTIEQIHRKTRKLTREVGPLRFELATADERVFKALLEWKGEQYKRRAQLPIFRYPWVVALLERVHRHSSERMSGVLSALWAGERLAAVHLGMRSPKVLHFWFPTFNSALEQYSPGLIMMLRLAEHAAANGITRIDLGTGEERYKQQLKSGDTPLLVGGVDFRMGRAHLRRNWYALNQWVRQSQYREYLEIPLNSTRRYRQWLGFR
jgi:CelD/BcsL family acetyltransferase involved in cellulose biosynthesis